MIKLQHLTVIFVIILVPITFLISFYMKSQITSVLVQSKYDTQLMDATYDAVRAFQINTLNNNYSTVSNSKIRDIEASVATFYNSLATSMGSSAISKETIKNYTPALVYNLYDGYYIYNNHYNTELKGNEGETIQEYGLEPYVYYSCRYVKNKGTANATDCIVNFTLDNAITVYGVINGTYYSPKTGYVINPNELEITGGNIKQTIDNAINTAISNKTPVNIDTASLARQIANTGTLKYSGVEIKSESGLGEYLLILTQTGNNVASDKQYYRYTYYNNNKVYADKDANGNENGRYFWYDTYSKKTVNDKATQDYAKTTIGKNTSALEYYIEAYSFSKWVNSQMGTISLRDAVDTNGSSLVQGAENVEGKVILKYSNDTEDLPIFLTTTSQNDPEKSESIFNNHRMSVIRYAIETNLIKAIANYNTQMKSGYEYTLPIMNDGEWFKISNNVCLTSFMQGIAIGAKYYNNYCVVSNNQNKEFVSKNSIVIMLKDEENKSYTYHLPNCKSVIDGMITGKTTAGNIMGVYTEIDLGRKSANLEINGEKKNFYFYHQGASNNIPYLNSYDCIVNIQDTYELSQLIDGKIELTDEGNEKTGEIYNASQLSLIRNTYFTALAREKYNFYKSLSFLN